jgi:luciferase family oxidoreductase group 1
MRLSVLDQLPVAEGSAGGAALRNSIELARLCDRLGFCRYWVAEHHQTPSLACTSPEVLIPLLAHETSRIRVGSGGIMLPHYSPLKVAETFSMLAGLFPGRIDLGLGRAPGSDQQTAYLLQRDRRQRSPDDFPDQLEELLGYIENRKTDLPTQILLPGRPEAPEPWLLGSSHQSAIWAAERGLPYCFADFINANGAAFADHYRRAFIPSERLEEPRMMVAVWAICAETESEARTLAASFQMMMTLLYRGQLIPIPPVEKALEFLKAEGISPGELPPGRRMIVGTPAQVRNGIETVAAEYHADEVMLVNILHNHQARMRSYELVASEFGLDGGLDKPHTSATPMASCAAASSR